MTLIVNNKPYRRLACSINHPHRKLRTEAGAAAVRKAGELRAIIAKYPLISSVKSALAASYRDQAWGRVALPLQPLNAVQARALAAAMAERIARA
jgi:hypothetical protein